MNTLHRRVSVILTVRNDSKGCRLVLDSLLAQTRAPDEIVVVDAGSTDGTWELLQNYAGATPHLRIHSAPGANIAQGRNLATQHASGEIIAATDGGCSAEPTWLERLVQPFDEDRATEFVAGLYRVSPYSLFESVVGLATMRGQLDPVDPRTFNPSGRSMAYTKDVWRRAGGFPEWVRFSEDTLFDLKLRQLRVNWKTAPGAVVHWRPRCSFHSLAKQFYHYGTGRGHTQIGAPDFRYNLRNAGLVLLCAAGAAALPVLWGVVGAMTLYFYGWTFHPKAIRIARRLGNPKAYSLCFAVMWTVLVSNTAGYLVGTLQRLCHARRYLSPIRAYMAT